MNEQIYKIAPPISERSPDKTYILFEGTLEPISLHEYLLKIHADLPISDKEWIESEAPKRYWLSSDLKGEERAEVEKMIKHWKLGATAHYTRTQKVIDAYADLTVALTQENTELRNEVRDLRETAKGYRDSYDQD